MTHPAIQYAQDVLSGEVTACRYVKLAAQRFLNDLERTDVWMDWQEANKVINVISNFKQWKGKQSGDYITLQPHQQFILANQFGFKKHNLAGNVVRRFSTSYEEVARKNAKTTIEAAKQLYHLAFESESGPQIYAGATKEAQAQIVVNDAGKIAQATPALRSRLKNFDNQGNVRRVVNYENGGFVAALGSDSKRLDGLDPSWASIDEYHAHPDNGVRDVIETGMGAREQPFLDIITTAGYDRHSVCYEFRDVVIRVLEGQIEDDSLFGIIFTLDEEDDWRDEQCWAKANPMLDVSVSRDYLANEVNKAQNEGSSKVVSVLTKNFNVWTDSAQTWISGDLWANLALNKSDEELSQVPCWGGLDLSSTSDLTAFVLVFHCQDSYHFKYWFFTPEDRARLRDEDRGTPYTKWVRDGHLLKNEGNVIDYDFVQQVIEQAAERYNIQSIAFDRYNAVQVVQRLQDAGINMSPFNQSIGNMSSPTKELERRISERQVSHEPNGCMDWMMSNVEIFTDANENIKITKRNKVKSRVDGPVASVMAFGEMLTNNQPAGPSIYEQNIGLL